MSEPRPIVFRARRVDTGDWCFAILNGSITVGSEPYGYEFLFMVGFARMLHDCLLDRSTLGEWTGRRDSEGRMVFEGDTACDMGVGADDVTFTIEWCEKRLSWMVGELYLEDQDDTDYRVVGTIHDAKEDV